jgi:hypothetical protein
MIAIPSTVIIITAYQWFIIKKAPKVDDGKVPS